MKPHLFLNLGEKCSLIVPAYTLCGNVPGMQTAGHRYLFSSFHVVTGVICRALLHVHTHTVCSYNPGTHACAIKLI